MNLPQINPRFHIPPLKDIPQDPIIDGLQFLSSDPHHLPTTPNADFPIMLPDTGSLWVVDAASRNSASRSQIMSWDTLRPTYNLKASPTPFLSEQSTAVFASAQYLVQPTVDNPIYVSQDELIKSLKMAVLGASSALHTWDIVSERFVGHGGFILIDGKNEVVSESFMKIFLTIGTILRRLEMLVDSLRTKSARAGPTTHAFAHALLSVIAYLRETLAKSPLLSIDSHAHKQSYLLSAISLHYAKYEQVTLALASLCNRHISLSPCQYPTLEPQPPALLSHIYTHLHTHLECQSPRLTTGCLAYILTATSRDYIASVCQSVGLGGDTFGMGVRRNKSVQNSDLFDDEDEGDREDRLFEEMSGQGQEEEFPTFFGPELAEALGTARKSLVLLRTAMPDHPLLSGSAVEQREMVWLWSEVDVEAAWAGTAPPMAKEDSSEGSNSTKKLVDPSVAVYQPELAAQFGLYDLEPGVLSSVFYPSSAGVSIAITLSNPVHSFISRFPSKLHALTPTLAHLNELTFAPLISRASELSKALLGLFLSPSRSPSTSPHQILKSKSNSNLNFSEHLFLLRSYILLTSHAFKSRLAAALFSDSGECGTQADGVDVRARQLKHNNGPVEVDNQWAVGLAPALTDRESWPPGGADLSFLLRTVIVDSLDEGRFRGFDAIEGEGEECCVKGAVLDEAEWRLGFAIRDLPVGAGRDRWLNPSSIEALDFLYIDYKPPHPLNVLITPIILSKYQRIFAFILRMMRVEHVSKSFFRMTRNYKKPLFLTLTASNKLLLHFRFITHSFVTALSSYVFDTAIGGNFDAFLARLSPPLGSSHSRDRVCDYAFSDVFALADVHSMVLDNILSACLLRSGQRAVGDLLSGVLELVLELGMLAGELKRGKLEEYEAAPLLEDLYEAFRSRMSTLTKVLKALVEKGSTISKLQLEAAMRGTGEGNWERPPGAAESLYHLLIRLDLGEWWASSWDGQGR